MSQATVKTNRAIPLRQIRAIRKELEKNPHKPRFFSIKYAVRLLNGDTVPPPVSYWIIYRLVKVGEIKAVRLGGYKSSWIIPATALLEFLEKHCPLNMNDEA
jgi:hypothetical protein